LFECRHRKLDCFFFGNGKRGLDCNHLVDTSEVVSVIGGDVKKTVRFESAINRIEKFGGEQSASMMPALRPGIWKKHMESRNRTRRQQVGDGVRTLHPENADVFQIRSRDLPANTAYSTEQTFDPEEISVWILPRDGSQKHSVTAAEIDLHWSVSPEDFAKVQLIDN